MAPIRLAVLCGAWMLASFACTRDAERTAPNAASARPSLPAEVVTGSGTVESGSVYATVHRIADLVELVPPSGEPRQCAVADEFRPALGCLESLPLGPDETAPRPPDGILAISGAVPRRFWGEAMLIEPRIRGEAIAGFKTAPAQAVESGLLGFEIETELPPLDGGGDLEVQLRGYVVPPADRAFVTTPIEIHEGDTLAFGIALNEIGLPFSEAAVEFRVSALVEGENGDAQELFTTRLDPETWTGAWVDHRSPLSALAGKTVRLRFQTSVARGMAFPLWGAAEILRPTAPGSRRNLILISLDTWRRDHFDGDVSGGPVTPQLAKLAETGAVFDQAITTYPSTSASHMSLFTGLYPITHQVRFANDVLGADWPTLAELLAARGYQTGAVTENAMLLAETGFMFGFDSYFENKGLGIWSTDGQIDSTLERGRAWLQAHDRERFFLFLHTYQIHSPYEPPPAYLLGPSEDELEDPSIPPWITRLRHRYAGEVRYADVVLARFLRELEASGQLADSIVILTSDHGEEFAEHGKVGHSKSVYDEVLRVPLLVWAPGLVREGLRIDSMVSLVDVVPTVLDLLGIPPPPKLQGRSLRAALEGTQLPQGGVRFAEGPDTSRPGKRLIAARTETHKWIAPEDSLTPTEIYDLRVDPAERSNMDDQALRDVGRTHFENYAGMVGGAAPKRDLDARTTEKLRALGYLE